MRAPQPILPPHRFQFVVLALHEGTRSTMRCVTAFAPSLYRDATGIFLVPLPDSCDHAPIMGWPKHLPPGCPSDDTANVDGEVYRLILKATGAGPKDWQSHAERCRKGCDYCNNVPECQRAALSVRLTLKDALASLQYNRRYEAIAQASLTPEHGKVAQTGIDVTHYSLWLRAEALESVGTLFSLVSEEHKQ